MPPVDPRPDDVADSERGFRALAQALPVICWIAGPSGAIEWYNSRWYEYTGLTREEAVGWGWQTVHHPEDFLDVMRAWPHSIATGKPFEMEFRLRRRDGEFHWFLARAEPVFDEGGKVSRWYGTTSDIDVQKQALERTKRIAETLQDVFLPKQLPQRPRMRIDAIYLPAEKDALVGGDWYDAFELPDGRLAISIGDVAGHGLQASIAVGRLRQIIFTLAFHLHDPAEILHEADRISTYQDPETLITALVAFIDKEQTHLVYASAGHPPPLMAHRNDEIAVSLPPGGLPLGTGFALELQSHDVPIEPDAVIALYTDGIIEFSHDVLGNERKLRAALAMLVGNTHLRRPASAIREIVLDDAAPRDDAALMILQCSAQAVDEPPLHDLLERTWRFHSSHAYTVHLARREIVKYLRDMAAEPDRTFAAELIVGEVLANTVEHAPGLVEVRIDWSGKQPVLSVRDTGPGLANLSRQLPDDPLSENGRGIYLIRQLAERASVRPAPGYGTELSAVLPIARRTMPT